MWAKMWEMCERLNKNRAKEMQKRENEHKWIDHTKERFAIDDTNAMRISKQID